jgi:penicillin amidase
MRSARWALVLLSVLLLGVQPCGRKDRDTVAIPGLLESVRVVVDREGVPHIYAGNDLDLARVAGYVHARDRFFQMDLTRREVSGDRAEVLGSAFIGSDIQNRTIGLRRAAERSLTALTPREHEVLQSYADGVNAYILNHPLPSEYASLELTQVRPWDVVDTLVIGKAIAASLSLDIDVGLDQKLQEYVDAGSAGGYDGEALLFQDVLRSAPMDPASTVPDATGDMPFDVAARKPIDPKFLARVAPLSRGYAREVADNRLLAMTLPLARREQQIGSNEWGVSASSSASGNPIIANDPHLSLNMPSTFYEWHLHVSDDPEAGPMNVSGVGFPGAPGVILGQNERITWGSTTNPMDVSDVFLDRGFVNASECGGAFVCIESDGQFHPAELSFAIYLTNQIGDGIQDNIVPADVSLLDSVIVTVPFRGHGPVIFIENPGVFPGGGETDVLVLQYTGFHATREVGTFLTWNRARNLDEFVVGLQSFDVGSQNWAYADVEGNLAYFSSAELPLRKDLEQGFVFGAPPFMVRDGSGPANWVPDAGHSQGQAIPYAVLPFDEMPQTVNPEHGFFVNANNDPAGTTLDNDPLNQKRKGQPNAIYYLNPGYANGLRAGRITRLVRDVIEDGKKVSVDARRDRGRQEGLGGTDARVPGQHPAARRRADDALPARGLRQREAPGRARGARGSRGRPRDRRGGGAPDRLGLLDPHRHRRGLRRLRPGRQPHAGGAEEGGGGERRRHDLQRLARQADPARGGPDAQRPRPLRGGLRGLPQGHPPPARPGALYRRGGLGGGLLPRAERSLLRPGPSRRHAPRRPAYGSRCPGLKRLRQRLRPLHRPGGLPLGPAASDHLRPPDAAEPLGAARRGLRRSLPGASRRRAGRRL